jgi:hypothetical protein
MEKDMNKHTQQLMQYSPQTLKNRVDTLQAEKARERESLPTKVLAFAAVLLSLYAVGLSFGYSSMACILPALFVAGYGAVWALGAWGLSANLRDSKAALKLITDTVFL